MEPYRDVVDAYRSFAVEAAESPTFADWSQQVADDPELVAWLRTLPAVKQQPNLVFAAARWHGVPAPGPYTGLREALLTDQGAIRQTILTRATQTNEVGRMATLLPAFTHLARSQGWAADQPVTLVEVGASAGLCLYPDRWGYLWQTDTGPVRLGEAPSLGCLAEGAVPLPPRLPVISRRAGIDLNPLDVTDHAEMTWLETLVWPEQQDRRARLRHGIEVARTDPPHLVRGDLLTGLTTLLAEVSGSAPVIVFHSAVIAYLEPADRLRFDASMRGLVSSGTCHWVSNEGPRVLPSVTASGPPLGPEPTFVLGVDGQMVARTHGHGRSLSWTL